MGLASWQATPPAGSGWVGARSRPHTKLVHAKSTGMPPRSWLALHALYKSAQAPRAAPTYLRFEGPAGRKPRKEDAAHDTV